MKVPDKMPTPRPRAKAQGEEIWTLEAPLELVTVSMGGGVKTREVGLVDGVRAPSVRGHLRMHWRALYGVNYADKVALAAAEQALWGGVRGGEVVRSQVELLVVMKHTQPERREEIDFKTPGFYALWTARAQKDGTPAAQHRPAGSTFQVVVRCPAARALEVENALRAWILFGGYGARTRRGLGSLTVRQQERPQWTCAGRAVGGQRRAWLPDAAQELAGLFDGVRLWGRPARAADDMPIYQGAALLVGAQALNTASAAWLQAVDWLQQFRQGQPGGGAMGTHDPQAARERGDQQRPGRSNWPEADKVRRLSGQGPWAHAPQHNGEVAWPRASFGLPIVSQFQKKDRNKNNYAQPEPANYEVQWSLGGTTKDRLASPLVVKALPLSGGRYAPCALWLYRGFPQGGRVVLKDGRAGRGGEAGFDELVARGDQARFAPLARGQAVAAPFRMRTAFLEWVQQRYGAVAVAPIMPVEVRG
jgi:CRISPR-associated protein Cmr1